MVVEIESDPWFLKDGFFFFDNSRILCRCVVRFVPRNPVSCYQRLDLIIRLELRTNVKTPDKIVADVKWPFFWPLRNIFEQSKLKGGKKTDWLAKINKSWESVFKGKCGAGVLSPSQPQNRSREPSLPPTPSVATSDKRLDESTAIFSRFLFLLSEESREFLLLLPDKCTEAVWLLSCPSEALARIASWIAPSSPRSHPSYRGEFRQVL